MPGKKGKCKLVFVFKEKIWPEMQSFDVAGASLIPKEQVAKVMSTHEKGPTSVKTLAAIKNVVEGWCALFPELPVLCCMHLPCKANDDLRVPGKLLKSVMRKSRPTWLVLRPSSFIF